jgi:hypothetical protein
LLQETLDRRIQALQSRIHTLKPEPHIYTQALREREALLINEKGSANKLDAG